MVNEKNIQQLIDVLRSEQYGFDMGRFVSFNHCGTVCCIAGTAWVISKGGVEPGQEVDSIEDNIFEVAKDWMGLDDFQAMQAFIPWRVGQGLWTGAWTMEATREQAIAMLEKLRDTGEVEWMSRPMLDRKGFKRVSNHAH